MPAVLNMMRTAARGLVGLSKVTLQLEPVSEAVAERRRRICAVCPAATRTRSLGLHPIQRLTPLSTCTACHCNLQAKTRLAGEACPRGHWSASVAEVAPTLATNSL